MRIVMLAPFPPMRGGISSYANQTVQTLRDEGHDVVVASPEPTDAEQVIDIQQRGSGRSLANLARTSDRLVVQFYPEVLGPPRSPITARGLALLRLAHGLRAAPWCELVIHEVNYGAGPSAPILRRLVQPVWRQADVITVHTERERGDFGRAFGISSERIRVVGQGEYLLAHTHLDRAAARNALGLPRHAKILLAIGFLHPHKGFDRAIRAFGTVGDTDARLYVVGSVWREDPVIRQHVHELERLSAETPGTEFRQGYLTDEEFDRWVAACDALVLPYRGGWSSNVMERGLLYGRVVVMSRVGGMAEQGVGRTNVLLVGDDAELVDTLRQLLADGGQDVPRAAR